MLKKKRISFEEAISSLGDNADTIAKRLKKLRIKGEVSNPKSCPIAVYLSKKGFESVDVTYGGIRTMSQEPQIKYKMTTPKYLQDFLRLLDCGWYPELVTKK